jgi:hypothetical protein
MPGIPAYARILLVSAFALAVGPGSAAPSAAGMEAYKMKDDFAIEPLSDCSLQYYYYIPAGNFAWFWAFAGPIQNEIMGAFFEVGDISMYTGDACDPGVCHMLNRVRILDFGGYGDVYPGLNSIDIAVYCSDEEGCPVGPMLWHSGAYDCVRGWNYIDVEPPVCLSPCSVVTGPPPVGPRILVTAMCIGTDCFYPAWGFDNISTPLFSGSEMHDLSCLTALYPRPQNSHYGTVHSGYYGEGFMYCPPIWINDGRDTTRDGSQFGAIELAWTIYLSCSGPTASEATTWGGIKSMYR